MAHSIPFLAYQRNIRLDKYQGDKNMILLQLGTSLSPTNTLDDNVDSSNYVLMLPGYVNPFITLYTVQSIGKKGLAFHANFSTGFKLLPFNTIRTKNGPDEKTRLADNTFLQYYGGFGAGVSFKRYLDFNVQYNRIYHDILDETREKFRAEYPGRNFHGSYVDVNLRAFPFTIPVAEHTLSFFTEFIWRGLGKSYQKNKTVALGLGFLLTLKEKKEAPAPERQPQQPQQ